MMIGSQQTVTPARATRPRVFYGWYIVAASVAMNTYLSIAFFLGFQVFYLPILKEFGWSRALTSGAFSLRQLETGVLDPVFGILNDRWGPRRIILIGVILGGVGMILLSTISSIWAFYLLFLLASIGVGAASHGVSWVVAVARWFRRLRGRAMGLAMLGPVFGAPFVVLVVALEQAVGWRSSLVLLGAGLLVVGIPLAFVARSRPEDYGQLPDGERRPEPAAPSAQDLAASGRAHMTGMTVKEALRSRIFWVLAVLFGAQGIGTSGLLVQQIPYFQALGFSPEASALTVTFVFVLSGIGRLAVGSLLDAFDHRLVLAGLLLGQVAGYLVLLVATNLWIAFLFSLLFGVAFGGMIPGRPILVALLFGGRAFGAIQGLLVGATIASGMVGPVLMGYIFDVTGSYMLSIVIFAAIVLAATPLVLLLRSGRPTQVGGPVHLA
ncbi:MAG: MFS transporter [Chloroflexi bacterium]|nr:MFS transporter [Chloroflexota bacterium]